METIMFQWNDCFYDFSFALIIIQHKDGSKNLRLTASSNKNTTFILTTI